MPYNYELTYRPGKDAANPADFISRRPDKSTPFPDNVAEHYVSYLCNNVIPKAMTLPEVKTKTKNDSTMQKPARAIETNDWSDPAVKPYTTVQPQTLQRQAIELAHTGHQGIVKTKRLLREKVWFSSIDRMVQERIKNCIPCQAATQATIPKQEPLNMTALPKAPWNEVAIDFVGPFPSGEVLLVVIDEFSRFPEVEILHSTTANSVIQKQISCPPPSILHPTRS